MPVPSFDHRGLLPAFVGQDATTADRSPYVVTIEEVVAALGTTASRRQLLTNLLAYRTLIASDDYIRGYQFLDGSFAENVEVTQSRSPGDIDVFSILQPPQKYVSNNAAWASQGLPFWTTEIVDQPKNKQRYSLDTYGIVYPNPGIDEIRALLYWYSLFAHQKTTFEWKGFILVPLDAAADARAASLL